MIRLAAAILALATLPALALAEGARTWPSQPRRGTAPAPPPCTCRGPAVEVAVGEEACLATGEGGRRARCVMVENNTSWAFGGETCPSPLTH